MKILSHLSFLFFGTYALSSQAQGGWQRVYPSPTAPNGDGIEAVRQTADGGYILAGVGQQNSSAGQSRVVKTDDQGTIQWANTYALGNMSWATNIEIAPAGGYFVSGRLFNTTAWADRAYLQKLDIYGNQVWLKEYPEAEQAFKGDVTADGGYVSVAYYDNNSTQDTILIIKTDAAGNTDWIKKYPNQGTGIERLPHSIIQTDNGEYVIEGYKDVGFGGISFLWRLDAVGDSLWQYTYGTASNHPEYIGKVVENPDGSLVLCGNDALSFGDNDIYLLKTTASGTMLWQQRFGSSVDFGTDLDRTADGGYILTGFTNNIAPKVLLLKTDASGNLQWQKVYNGDAEPGYNWKPYSVRQTSDGGYVVGGAKLTSVYSRENMYLLKTDDLGEIYSNTLQGYVYHDADADCDTDAAEHRFGGWLVKATGNQTFYTSTDTNGYYWMRVDTGNYQLTLQPAPNHPYWQNSTCTNDSLFLSIPNQQTTIDTSFAQLATVSCPLLTVDMSTPFLRRCFNNSYHFQYCNHGSVDAPNSYIEVDFDAFLSVNTASIGLPWTDLGSNRYRFDLGTVGIGDCGNFSVQVYVDCDSTVLGQTHCSEAHIYPDSSCATLWAGPDITIEADCMGDSVIFSLTNTGANMPASLAYVVYEDNVLLRPGTFALNNGESLDVSVATNGGATYRIEAEQALGFPAILGNSLIALAIEGCGDSINTGFVTQFANFDGSPFYDLDCQENIGAYDPNDKRGFPKGYGEEHYIYANTDLDYHIRFQNTGTDTAFYIVIRDTLSEHLDPATLQAGSSSHPYTWKIYGQGGVQAIEFSFYNIQLPDSNVNEPASHGFVQFSIQQKANNPVGTLIENTAAIYFDFNAPVFTNTTFHEIGEDFVEVFVVSDKTTENAAQPEIRIYPNPFSDVANIEVLGSNSAWHRFYLYDNLGRQLVQMQSNQSQFQLNRNDLMPGVYFYRIENAEGAVGTGKLVVR